MFVLWLADIGRAKKGRQTQLVAGKGGGSKGKEGGLRHVTGRRLPLSLSLSLCISLSLSLSLSPSRSLSLSLPLSGHPL